MKNAEDLLTLADRLVRNKTGRHLSDLQRILLLNALRGVKRSYDDIAETYNYSPRYLRQNIAAKLWQLLSQVLACKVSKSNVRSVLESQIQTHLAQPVKTQQSKARTALEALLPSSPLKLPSAAAPLSKGNILIVDNNLGDLTLLSRILKDTEHRVQQAVNAEMVLELALFSLPDVLLLGGNTSELNSYSLCQKLKDNPVTQDIPVIFVSTPDESWDSTKAFAVGGSDYITKPFKAAEVVARVQTQLSICQLRKTLRRQTDQLQATLLEIDILKNQLEIQKRARKSDLITSF